MSHSYSSSSTYIVAGEKAPSPADALSGVPIVVGDGDWAITELKLTDGPDSTIELDTSVEPNVLRLRNVGAKGIWGALKEQGFVLDSSIMHGDAGYWIVSGDYVGPGSELTAADAI